MKDYNHVFFDLDRTLWDFETNSYETLSELAHKYKIAERGVDSLEEFISRYIQINELMWDKYRKGLIDKNTLRYQRFYEIFEKYEIKDTELIENFGNDYLMASPLKTNLFPHCIEVLQYLNQKYALHIITNGFEEVQHIKIKNCGIGHFFEHIITSERSGFKKPDLRIFQYSMDVADAKSANSIMIGDSLEADIIGARNAGIHQVYFNPCGDAHTEDVTFEIKSLIELTHFL